MKRRELLKNLGLGAGFLVVGPTTLSLLESCKNEPRYSWEPTFLSASSGFALQQILDVIIPETETPGASQLNLAQFIDAYVNEVVSLDARDNFKEIAEAFSKTFEADFGKGEGEGSPEEFREIVAKYLRATPAQQEEYDKRLTETQDPQDKDPNVEGIDPKAGAYSYLSNVRDLAIWGWKTSEKIGEDVLWYDPIPGEYIPCVPVEEVGNGKAMSL